MSSTLAIVLTVVLGILLVVGLGALILYKRHERGALGGIPHVTPPQVPPQQELSSLGIIEIRPKPRKEASNPDPAPSIVEEDSVLDEEEVSDLSPVERDHEYPAESRPEPLTAPSLNPPLPSPGAPRAAVPEPAPTGGGRPDLNSLLQGVRAAAGGVTVALVRQVRRARFELLAIVSESPHIRSDGEIAVHPGLLDEAEAMTPVSIKDLGTDDSAWEDLGYYRAPVPVRQVALVPVRVPDDEQLYLLLVDAMAWRDLDDPWQRLLLGQFATLIGTYLASPLPGDAAHKDRLRIRPRREIIAEEIERAREDGRSLSLALIYLNRAEDIAEQGVKALGAAERAMKRALEEGTRHGRLERFGELTYGVFHDEPVAEVEAWALRLQETLAMETETLAGGVSIGIALLQDRHQSPDALRADATEALREAFETGACTIIE